MAEPTELQKEAKKKLEEYERMLERGDWVGWGLFTGLGVWVGSILGSPLLGAAYGVFSKWLTKKRPPELLDYMDQLREVIKGNRHTMPKAPQFSPKNFGR